MELSARKKAILSAIVRAYIETGEPVGSKALCSIVGLGLSSATLRNEMSDLCEQGYLSQPHTSAGRVPTSKGYRLYVEDVMQHETVSPEMRLAIDALLPHLTGDPERLPGEAGELLYELTGLPVLTATVTSEASRIRRVESSRLGRRSALLVLVTSDGMTHSRLCRTPVDLTPESLERFEHLAAERLVGTALSDLTPAVQQNLAVSAAGALDLLSLLTALLELIGDAGRAQLSVRGESNLFSYCKQDGEARRLLELIARQDAILSLLSELNRPVSVIFGDDTRYDALKPSSMVVASYQTGERALGRIGVLGPTRMSYKNLIPGIAYFASRLSGLMSEALKDMED